MLCPAQKVAMNTKLVGRPIPLVSFRGGYLADGGREVPRPPPDGPAPSEGDGVDAVGEDQQAMEAQVQFAFRHLRLPSVAPSSSRSAKRLFEEGGDQKALELVDAKTFDTGVVYLTYRPTPG
jgi:hypothetical protein